jgi:hypothetical protein
MTDTASTGSDERVSLAERLIGMSGEPLSMTVVGKYIAIEVGTGTNKNAVLLSNRQDRVSFFIRSTELLNEVAKAGFKVERNGPEFRYRVWNVSVPDLEHHESLFRKLMGESMDVVRSRRSRKS